MKKLELATLEHSPGQVVGEHVIEIERDPKFLIVMVVARVYHASRETSSNGWRHFLAEGRVRFAEVEEGAGPDRDYEFAFDVEVDLILPT